MNKDIKLDKNSEFWIQVIVSKGTDELGRKYIKTAWMKRETDLNMGSIKEPKHPEVIAMKWVNKRNDEQGVNLKRTFDDFGLF